MQFKRKSRWIKINYTLRDENPFFIYDRKRYHLGNVNTRCPVILRTRNNVWSCFDQSDLPEYIHGYSDSYYNPIFIELNETGEAVRVYERVY